MLAAGLQPGEDQARFHLPHCADLCACWRDSLLVFCWLFSAGTALAQQAADHRSDSRHRQPAHSQGNHSCPSLYSSRRYLRSDLDRARLQFALEHRILRRSAHRARRHGKGHHPERLRSRKTHDPRNQLQGQQFGFTHRTFSTASRRRRSGSRWRASTTRPRSSGPRQF